MSRPALACSVALALSAWLIAAATAGTLLTPAGAPHHGDVQGKAKLAVAGLLIAGIAVAARK
ncbi:MAG: hypothetical protein AB7F51_13980 [Pseudorhodoplanes sp.]